MRVFQGGIGGLQYVVLSWRPFPAPIEMPISIHFPRLETKEYGSLLAWLSEWGKRGRWVAYVQ